MGKALTVAEGWVWSALRGRRTCGGWWWCRSPNANRVQCGAA